MTMTTDPIGTVGMNSDFFNPGGDIGDLAFAIAAYQLDSLDADLRNSVGQIKIIAELKKAYRARIDQVRQWLSSTEGDTVKIPADEAKKLGFSCSGDGGTIEARAEGTIGSGNDFYLVDKNGEEIKQDLKPGLDGRFTGLGGRFPVPDLIRFFHNSIPVKGDEAFVREVEEMIPGSVVMVELRKEDLETELSRLQGRLDDLTGDGELQLLQINRLLSRRNQALQLASNIMSSTHQSSMGIISNIK